ncbi:hypothetical protein BGX31_001337 [Mortierella sp. GBA43]|nr:hypothetical protein BGX31_001337 [Mortierella sp. GBA43]
MFCCPCLPRRQRDNLSSRALYPDQDSSGYEDGYSDDDNDHDDDRQYSAQYPRRLSYFQQQSRGGAGGAGGGGGEDHRLGMNDDHQQGGINNNNNNNSNPWPSNFHNGRFSRQVNRSLEASSGASGRNYPRRPNPFRTFDKDGSDGDDSRGRGRHGDTRDGRTGMTSFEPYRDDDDEEDQHREGYDDDDECDNEHQGLLKGHHRTQLLPKMDYTPFKLRTPLFLDSNDTHSSLQEVRAPSSLSLSSQPRSKPRNPQGKRTWKDNDDGMADAEEILDVNDLIAEQERIAQELARQEEALRKEEEEAIVAKRMAAIRAAERRGLLRFEGDQLVISNSSSDSSGQDEYGQRKRGTVQGDGDWNYSRRIQEMHLQSEDGQDQDGGLGVAIHSADRTSSSAASSFVGGIDAFNQELKMMTLNMEANRNKQRPKAVSTGVSTSAASTSNGATINPRGVFNSVASFLKKVDGVIAGETGDSSSDEAATNNKTGQPRQKSNANGPQALVDQGLEQVGRSNDSAGPEAGAGTRAGEEGTDEPSREAKKTFPAAVTVQLETEVQQGGAGGDSFGTVANDSVKPSSSILTKEPEAKPEAPAAHTTPIDPAASGGMITNTLSSIFSTGASLIGYFGGGGVSQHYDSDDEYHADYIPS